MSWKYHVLEADRMSDALRDALEIGEEYGVDLAAELSQIARPGRCPEHESGWNIDESWNASWSPASKRGTPVGTARIAKAMRPDLDVGRIEAVLTADPNLTAREVIEILDPAVRKHKA